jgi:regulatory protein
MKYLKTEYLGKDAILHLIDELDQVHLINLHIDSIIFKNLIENQTLSEEELKDLKTESDKIYCTNELGRMISFKNLTTKEVFGKLKDKGFDLEIITDCIESFANNGYLNDEMYKNNVLDHSKDSYGYRRVKEKLYKKGIHVENYEYEEDINSIIKLIEKKAHGKRDLDKKEKNKVYNFLLYRGFKYENIERAYKIYEGKISKESWDSE